MRSLNTIQNQLARDTKLAPVNLLVITTYSDRDTPTAGDIFYISDRGVHYDWKNAGTVRRFLPWLATGGLGDLAASMTHLPHGESGGLLRKSMSLVLNNQLWPDDASGTRVIELLRASYPLEGATVELGQYLVQTHESEYPADYTTAVGNEHTFFYRGRIAQVGPITDAEIRLECVADLPAMTWLRGTDPTAVDPLDLGVRLAKVYGQKTNVPCINLDVGFATTLATAVEYDATTFVMTDATGIGTTGQGIIGGEVVEWSGKSGNSLTGVDRAVDLSPAANHRAGEIFVEIITTATFAATDHEVNAIGDVKAISPYTGKLTRLTGSFTKTVNDTTAISGETIASIKFTQEQMRDALKELASSPDRTDTAEADPTVLQRPIVEDTDFDTAFSNVAWLGAVDGEIVDTGPDLEEDDVGRFHFFRPSAGFPRQLIKFRLERISGIGTIRVYGNQYPGGTPAPVMIDDLALIAGNNEYTADITDGDYEWISLEIRSTTTADVQLHDVWQLIDNDGGGVMDYPTHQRKDGFAESSSGNMMDQDWGTNDVLSGSVDWGGARFADPATSYDTQRIHVKWDTALAGDDFYVYVGTSWSSGDWTKIHPDAAAYFSPRTAAAREFYFETQEVGNYIVIWRVIGSSSLAIYEFERELMYYGAPLPSTVQIAGASVGFGLRLFADIDGYEAPSASPAYQAGTGGLIEKPADVLRHLVEVLGGADVDTVSLATCVTNLGASKIAVDLRAVTPGPWEIAAAALGFLSRANLVPEEELAGTVWKLLTAETDYDWSAKVRSIDAWEVFSEVSAADRPVGPNGQQEIYTRFQILYDYNAGIESQDESGFEGWLQSNEDTNDLTVPSAAEMTTAVAKYGNYEAPPIALMGINEVATAKNVGGYYVHEGIRAPRTFLLGGVPARLAYDLEAGDVIDFVHPWSAATVKARVVEYVKNFRTEQADLRCVEVE